VVVGSAGGAPGQFSLPRGVATDVDGNLYVAEGGNNRISKFDANGNFVKTIGGRGGGDGQFTGLSDVAIDPFGNLWVTNTDGRSIDRFDLDGTFISSATSFKNEPIRPASVAAAPDGSIYALNYGTNEVMRFTDDGEPILGKSATVRVVKGTAGEEGCGHGLAPEWRRVQRLRQAPRGGATAAKKPKVVRQLWGSGKGNFRTTGRFASATLRGTKWLTVDRCDGTLVRVTQGVIAVRDLVRKKTVVLRKGKSYFARAKR
jgi:DNA-binding beta-propeller fold protein YncE